MPENIAAILPELWLATGQTFLMLGIGLSAAVLIGRASCRERVCESV